MAKLPSRQLPEMPSGAHGLPRVWLSGDLEGPYGVDSIYSDGSMVIVPDQEALAYIEHLRITFEQERAEFEAIYPGRE